jgi:hypothetical protein
MPKKVNRPYNTQTVYGGGQPVRGFSWSSRELTGSAIMNMLRTGRMTVPSKRVGDTTGRATRGIQIAPIPDKSANRKGQPGTTNLMTSRSTKQPRQISAAEARAKGITLKPYGDTPRPPMGVPANYQVHGIPIAKPPPPLRNPKQINKPTKNPYSGSVGPSPVSQRSQNDPYAGNFTKKKKYIYGSGTPVPGVPWSM